MKGADNSSDEGRHSSHLASTSVSLLELVKQGDRGSWERLMKLYRPLVLWWCGAKVTRPEDAEDVAQEVFKTVFKRIDEFTKQHERGSFRAWLKTITYHKLGDHMRHVRHQPAAAGGSDAQARLAELPDEYGQASSVDEGPPERRILLGSAMELLRAEFQPNTWAAAMRTAVDGQRAAEVAQALRMTTAAVYIAKSRVLKRLREEMANLLD